MANEQQTVELDEVAAATAALENHGTPAMKKMTFDENGEPVEPSPAEPGEGVPS